MYWCAAMVCCYQADPSPENIENVLQSIEVVLSPTPIMLLRIQCCNNNPTSPYEKCCTIPYEYHAM
eukprot:3447280-Rhodomonas_salina.4